jgi:hypothetical protein
MKDNFNSHTKEAGFPDGELQNIQNLFNERFIQYSEAEKYASGETLHEWAII